MEEKMLKTLFKLAKESKEHDEFPVAAIIYDDNGIISCGKNQRNRSNMTTDHAEIIAIQNANKKCHSWRLENMCMVVTLEPCEMCKAVIKEARLKEVYYLVPRYKYKNQYKCTKIEHLVINSSDLDDYLVDIKAFFSNKR